MPFRSLHMLGFGVVVAVAGAGQARAEDGIAVVGYGACTDPYGALPQHVRRFAEQLKQTVGSGVLLPDAASQRFGLFAPADLEAVALDVETGQTQYVMMRLDESERILHRALESLRGAPLNPKRQSVYVDANLLLAQVRRAAKADAEADALLERILALAPATEIDRKMYPPSFRSHFDSLRAKVADSRPRYPELTVEAPGPKASVYVDGCLIGTAPVQVRLPKGEYDVAVAWPDRSSRAHHVSLEGPQPTRVVMDPANDLAINPDGPCVEFTGDRRAMVAGAQRLAVVGDLKQIVAIQIEKGGAGAVLLGATLLGREGGRVQREGRIRLGPEGAGAEDLAALASFVMTGSEASRVIAVTTEPPNSGHNGDTNGHDSSGKNVDWTASDERTSRGFMTPLRWTGVGLGVGALAAAGTGIVFTVSAGQAHSNWSSLFQPSCQCFPPSSAAYVAAQQSNEQTDNTVAAVLYVSAGVLAVGSAGLFIYEWRRDAHSSVSILPTLGGAVLTGRW
jgi:hypothetical protein